MSFAQFEREVTGERIRDKIAASRRKGMWMGGSVPFGYVLQDRKLVPHETESPIVRAAYHRYIDLGSSTLLARELQAKGVTTKAGNPPNSQFVIRMGRVASITGQARSTLTRENGQPTDSNLAQPSSVILLRARTPICASVF